MPLKKTEGVIRYSIKKNINQQQGDEIGEEGPSGYFLYC